LEEVNRLVEAMIKDETIKPSKPSRASSVALVKRRDGGLPSRFDYRKLNTCNQGGCVPLTPCKRFIGLSAWIKMVLQAGLKVWVLKKSRDTTSAAEKSGPHFNGFLLWSIPLVANSGGVKEVDVLWVGDSLKSHNRRAELDVHLRHLPHPRVLQGSY
uniref:Acid phosphatase n=1 Tax=Taenia asiatica TaxID=60517 RepID=A0A0R3W4F3_TAEAS